MLPLERRQGTQIHCRQPAAPHRLGKHLLNHERVHVDQTHLKQVERQHQNLLVLEPIAGELSALAIEDKFVRTVPVLNHLQAFVDLAPQGFQPQVVAQKHRLQGLAQFA